MLNVTDTGMTEKEMQKSIIFSIPPLSLYTTIQKISLKIQQFFNRPLLQNIETCIVKLEYHFLPVPSNLFLGFFVGLFGLSPLDLSLVSKLVRHEQLETCLNIYT